MSGGSLLSEAALRSAAGQASYLRGEDYVRYVHGLRLSGDTAQASIQARNVYLVDLDLSGRRLTGSCTCPHFARGNFCKHLVALGLAVLDAGERRPSSSHCIEEQADHLGVRLGAHLGAHLGSLGAPELVDLVNGSLRTRGTVDYHRSFEVAQDAQTMLDVLENHLAGGAHVTAQQALLRALTRLRAISLRADDSSGSIGDACQRAADLYAQACRAGHPEPVKLARWLLRFRADSPGWPVTTLPDFVAAFDEAALRAYRRGVDALSRRDEVDSFEVQRMRLELADHDGDVDLAVTLLAVGDHPQYAAIVDRLRLAGRLDELTTWVDRAVADKKISREHSAAGRSYWLNPEEVAGEYLALDRVDDAVAVFRSELVRRPEPATFAALVKFAAMVDRESQERDWAIDELRSKAAGRFGSGAVLVQLAMADRDLEQAWKYADELGPGHAWQSLAAASARDHPAKAAALHRAQIEREIVFTDSKRYAGIAARLVTVRDLSLAAGEEREFADYLGAIRERYQRRPALMAALARRGL